MAKNGPFFEFVINKDGAKVEFVFLPGNSSKDYFNTARDYIVNAYKNHFSMYNNPDKDAQKILPIREITLKNGIPTFAIDQIRLPNVLKGILESRYFNDFSIKVHGLDKDGNDKTLVIANSIEVKQSTEVIPYYNKNNNDLTTRRNK